MAQEAEITERARVEASQVMLADRLRGALGSEAVFVLGTGMRVSGRLGCVGRDWFVLAEGMRQWLVPMESLGYVEALGRPVHKTENVGVASLPLPGAIRRLARDRAEVAVHVATGQDRGRVLEGVIDGVGHDFLDLAVTRGETRRREAVALVATVPFASLEAVCSIGPRDY
ncbi:hypothetical protein ACIPY2_01735 [Paenarthrobacter sp. NPDC089675]|uniref:hypothetical protein n=1 Tax=Paenarthrobacter sp. NPDC089675 TaxID=3364376 RepID=UPI0037F2D7E9